jgi:nucleotide-binding universal stress UspA family protein
MAPFRRILLPVAFSERSLDAARQVEVLALHSHSDVTVVHVVEPNEQESGRFEPGGVKGCKLETLRARNFTGASMPWTNLTT